MSDQPKTLKYKFSLVIENILFSFSEATVLKIRLKPIEELGPRISSSSLRVKKLDNFKSQAVISSF